ncbi:hypothetical protein AXG93_421s1210 [Marchantia polymorpha subsp. ruderalis]|uniref:Uncharacterized protein n=1 Tax=Marchantia polymorpha subsp. ruderalis TaxID=1480154 RepID=A0A176VL89_MARPO|nr:hypothetical protein AXG93_421s1210 [Marchantia polymorpha subsp. ruderalis]
MLWIELESLLVSTFHASIIREQKGSATAPSYPGVNESQVQEKVKPRAEVSRGADPQRWEPSRQLLGAVSSGYGDGDGEGGGAINSDHQPSPDP